ncbi:hypothetical protein REPUB_Repub04eG0032100 [Reevesia pubescens]
MSTLADRRSMSDSFCLHGLTYVYILGQMPISAVTITPLSSEEKMTATKTIHHTRCNSFPLPSRQHSLATEVNEHLNRLKASEAKSTSSSSISHKLNGFQDLYDCVAKLLQLPLSQPTLAQKKKEWVDELLDGSLKLLDLCGNAKDVVLQTKESANELQSVLRRRKSGELELVSEVRKYLTSRKVVKKTIHMALGNLKGIQTKLQCHSYGCIMHALIKQDNRLKFKCYTHFN